MLAIDAHSSTLSHPTPSVHLGGDTDTLLMSLVREALGYAPPDDQPLALRPDWDALCDQMWIHRLGGLAWPSLSRHVADLPPAAISWIRHFRDVTTRMNGANLLTMRRVLPRLQNEGIPCVAYKGPVLQQIAYGTVFMRPASDLDILVQLSDFKRAGEVIASVDYELADVCRSIWWKVGLGEQHFRSDSAAGTTIDLHHRVQQPGCPLPRQPSRLLTEAMSVAVGGQNVPTLSHAHSVLLAAMSYVKALHHREPAARYVIDVVALAKGLTSEQWREIEDEAQLQGLRNTLALTIRAAGLMLGSDTLPCGPSAPVLMQTSDATLIQMTLRSNDPSIAWPRRRDLLFALYDNKLSYPAGLAAMAGSELLRQLAEEKDKQPRLRRA